MRAKTYPVGSLDGFVNSYAILGFRDDYTAVYRGEE